MPTSVQVGKDKKMSKRLNRADVERDISEMWSAVNDLDTSNPADYNIAASNAREAEARLRKQLED